MFDNVKSKEIAVLGFSFKKNTSDIRESSAIDICSILIQGEAKLRIYDPQVPEVAIQRVLASDSVKVAKSAYECILKTHAVVVLTEWDEFKNLDFELIYQTMQKPAFIFDGRNILNQEELVKRGFRVFAIGKKCE